MVGLGNEEAIEIIRLIFKVLGGLGIMGGLILLSVNAWMIPTLIESITLGAWILLVSIIGGVFIAGCALIFFGYKLLSS